MTKVKTISVSNLKAISALTADFNGATAIITGKNNAGKSSFLRSLPDRLRGIKPDIILKSGESEGFATWELTTGEKFHWSFDNKTAKGERLSFITKDEEGRELKGSITEEIMKRYFPDIFDVDAFLQALPAKQKKMLEKLSGIDFTIINDRHKIAYDDRTFANKKLADAKVNLKPINTTLPIVLIDILPIQEEMYGVKLHNHKYDTAEAGLKDVKGQVEATNKEIKRLEQLLKTSRQELVQLEKRVGEGEKWLQNAENQPKDETALNVLSEKLGKAIDTNKVITSNNEAIKAKEDMLQLDIEAKKADSTVKEIELEKVEMVRKSNMPEGFSFADDGILYNGLPFTKEQLSSSGIYIAALKLAAMSIGEVKTLHFDASFLDKNSLAEIEIWANENGLQLLIERPDFEAGEITYELRSDIK